MGFKGIYKEKSSGSKIGILFLLIVTSVILHSLIALALIFLFTNNSIETIPYQDLTNQAYVNHLKFMQLFSGVGLFITPILLYAYITEFDFKFAMISIRNTLLVCTIMVLITPFIGLLLEWNMKIPLPEWILQFDINSEVIVTAFLKMDTIWDLLYTILVIAIVPSIGEELLFRGYLQQKFSNWLASPHIAILITSFFFSAVHLDLQGLIPRFFLGSLLGYLYYWSGSLWLPILAHFVNNTQAIIFYYPLFKVDIGAYSILSDTNVDPILALVSFSSVVLLLYLLHKDLGLKKN